MRLLCYTIIASLVMMFSAMSAAQDDRAQSSRVKHESGPRLSLVESEANLGKQHYFSPFAKKFQVSNIGTEPLIIKQESATCGCITNIDDILTIRPGAQRDIGISHRPDGTNPWSGPRSFAVKFSTNDPTRPEFILTIRADLVLPIAALPRYLDFGDLSDPARAVKTLHISFLPEMVSADSIKVVPSTDAIDVTPLNGDVGVVRYRVSVDGNAVPNRLQERITVKSDSEAIPAFEVPVRGTRPTTITAKPKAAMFGLVQPNTTESMTLTLSGEWGAEEPELTAYCTDTDIQAKLEKQDIAYTLQIEITTGAASATARTKRATIEIRGTNSVVLATIPVHAVVVND